MLVCTTVTRGTIAEARRLYQSLRSHGPSARLLALVLDDRELAIDPAGEPFELIRPQELAIDRFELLAGRLPKARLVRATQPSLIRLSLERAEGAPVLYLDSRTEVFGDLGSLGELAADRGFALVPRTSEPIPHDGLRPTDVDLLRAGVFDPGCLACASTERVMKLLRTWAHRLRHGSLFDASVAYLRWPDLLVALARGAGMSADPGIGVSVWNLHERRLTEEAGALLVDGEPLRTLCFAGLEPGPLSTGAESAPEDEMLTRGAALLHRNATLRRLAADRDAWLNAARHGIAGAEAYGFAELADGTPLSPNLREWIRLAERRGYRRSPFSADGTAALLDWLRTPTERGQRHGIPRIWLFVHAMRGDLHERFADLDGADGREFARWIREIGEREYDVPPALRITSEANQTG
jgi:hypothetical protein